MTKDELRAREYDGVPIEVCQAAYDTIVKEGYKKCAVLTDDQNLIDWIVLAEAQTVINKTPNNKAQFLLTCSPDSLSNLSLFAKKIIKGGQFVFYGLNPVPLRAFFNKSENYDDWSTIEIPLGEGLFIAKKIE
jgi:hypothetical protein